MSLIFIAAPCRLGCFLRVRVIQCVKCLFPSKLVVRDPQKSNPNRHQCNGPHSAGKQVQSRCQITCRRFRSWLHSTSVCYTEFVRFAPVPSIARVGERYERGRRLSGSQRRGVNGGRRVRWFLRVSIWVLQIGFVEAVLFWRLSLLTAVVRSARDENL